MVQGVWKKIGRPVQNLNYYTLVFGIKQQSFVVLKICQYFDTLGMPAFSPFLYISSEQFREVMLELCQ